MTFASPSFFTSGIPSDDALAPLGRSNIPDANTADMFTLGMIPVGAGLFGDDIL